MFQCHRSLQVSMISACFSIHTHEYILTSISSPVKLQEALEEGDSVFAGGGWQAPQLAAPARLAAVRLEPGEDARRKSALEMRDSFTSHPLRAWRIGWPLTLVHANRDDDGLPGVAGRGSVQGACPLVSMTFMTRF